MQVPSKKKSGIASVVPWLPSALAGGALLFCVGFYFREADRIRRDAVRLADSRVEMFVRILGDEVAAIADDLSTLSTVDSFQAYLSTGDREDLQRSVQRAIFYSNLKGNYDQLRYIDESGREIIRVDMGGVVVAGEALQDKSHRDYFQRTMELEPGSIYVSSFDLNMENGAVEMPIKPVWRYAVPVFDDKGSRKGIVVVNFLGASMLENLREVRPDLYGQLRILNSRGYWLKGSDEASEWGFALPGRTEQNLKVRDPELWRRIEDSPHSALAMKDAIEAWRRIDINDILSRRHGAIHTEEPYLVVALEMSGSEYQDLFANLRTLVLTIAVPLAAASLFLGRALAARWIANQAMRESEEGLSVTLNSIGDAVLATDTEGRVSRMNPVAERLTGWTGKEAQGRPVTEVFRIINELTRSPATIPVEQVLTSGEVQGLANHTVLIARDGSEHPIADSAAPIRGRTGDVVGVVMVFRDVTSERAAQKALSESEARYRTLFDKIDEGFCIVEMIFDANGKPVDYRFLEINPSFESQTGLADAVGKRMRELAPEHEEHWFQIYGLIAKTGESKRFQNRAEQLNRTYDVYAFRFGDPAKKQVAILFNDITEQERSREQVVHLNTDLRRQAEQLELANKELEAFSYSVSHDLRAPLRHVQGYVEMLTRDAGDSLSEKSRRYLRTIAEAGRDMGQLIDDLLAFSRMGRAELREEKVNTGALVEEVRNELGPMAPGRNVLWNVHPLPDVRGDAAMLKQVLLNLLGNALKYTRNRERAEIEVGWTGGSDGEVEFFVRDNGAGFDMKYVDKLFGVFERLHRADEFEGTGIGLATVRRIIARHGGRTWAEGVVNEGATFYFTLLSTGSDT